MVWGCLSVGGVGQLTFVRGFSNFGTSPACARRRAQQWIFQQDIVPCHTARASKTWMNEHGVQLLDWHAQSLDTSPIENMWGIIKAALSEHKPRNMQELRRIVVDEWNNIMPEQCKRLVENMPKRIQALVHACGLTTKYSKLLFNRI